MRAVQLVKFGEPREALQYTDLPDPKPGPGEVVVKIEAAGVCGRDLVVRRGAFPHVKPPVVSGHEGVGRVVEVGPGVEKELVGVRVFLSAVYDGTCEYCRRGLENLCRSAELLGESRNGAYAEYVLLPARRRRCPQPLHLVFVIFQNLPDTFIDSAALRLIQLCAVHNDAAEDVVLINPHTRPPILIPQPDAVLLSQLLQSIRRLLPNATTHLLIPTPPPVSASG